MGSTGTNGNSTRVIALSISAAVTAMLAAAVVYVLFFSDDTTIRSMVFRTQKDFYEDAKALYRRGETYKALERIREGVRDERDRKKVYRARLLSAVIYDELGQYPKAMGIYESLAGEREATEHVWHNLGDTAMHSGATSQAIHAYETALRKNARFTPSLIALGDVYFQNRSYKIAMEYYRRVLTADRANKRVLARIGMIYYQHGDRDRAIKTLTEAVDTYDAELSASVYAQLGTLYAEKGDNNMAAEMYLRSLKNDPGNTAVIYNLGVMYINRGDYEAASGVLSQALLHDPKNKTLLRVLGEVAFHGGALTNSLAYYRALADLQKDKYETIAMVADINYRLGNLLEAEKHYRYIVDMQRHDSIYENALINLGNVYDDLKRPEDALACYRSALRLSRDDSAVHYNAGIIHLKYGMPEEGIGLLKRAYKLNTNDTRPLIRIAEHYEKSGNTPNALELYEGIIAHSRNDHETIFRLGTLYRKMNDNAKAKRHFAYLAAAPNPYRADAYVNLGVIYDEEGDGQTALENFTRSISIEPRNPVAYYDLGLHFYDRGEMNTALSKWRLGLSYAREAPLVSRFYLASGNAYYKLKDYEMAEKSYVKAVNAWPRNGEASFNLKTVRERNNIR
ncbi:MAG: tetratricopeptide repeat protein [Spirochaetota bacterium]